MIKELALFLCLVLCSSVSGFAQNENVEKALEQEQKQEAVPKVKIIDEPVLNVEKKHFYDSLSIFFMHSPTGSLPDNSAVYTLKYVLETAKANSTALADAASKVKEAKYAIDEVKAAKGITLTGQLAGGLNMTNATDHSLAKGWRSNVTANYLITNFGLFESSKRAAWLSYFRAKLYEENILQNLYRDVITNYLNSLETYSLAIVADSSVELRKSQLEIAKAKYEEGLSPKYDMLSSEVHLKNAEVDKIAMTKAFELSKAALKNIMGVNQSEDFSVVRPYFFSFDMPTLDDAIKTAEINRLEMAQAGVGVEIAKTAVDIQKQGKNPSLALGSTYSNESAFDSNPNYAWTTLLSLNIPILDGGLSKARAKQAKEAVVQAELAKEQLGRDIALSINSALLEIEESRQKFIMAEASLDMAHEAYSIALVRYRENVGTFLELDDATNSYLSALASLASAYCGYERSQISMLYAEGILVDEVDKNVEQ